MSSWQGGIPSKRKKNGKGQQENFTDARRPHTRSILQRKGLKKGRIKGLGGRNEKGAFQPKETPFGDWESPKKGKKYGFSEQSIEPRKLRKDTDPL